MHILLVTDTYLPYITGVSNSTDSIARFMVSQGHQVTIVTPKPTVRGSRLSLPGLTVIEVPALPFSFYNNNALGIFPLAFPVILKLTRENKFDVVHIQEPAATGLAALIVAKFKHLPVVGALHFIPEQVDRVIWGKFERVFTPIINIYIKLVYDHYDVIMTPSHFFASVIKKLGIKRSIAVISNGVDTQQFLPKLHKNKSTVTFLYIGRLDGDKNVITLVRALPYTKNEVMLQIVGKGKMSASLHQLAHKLGVKKRIIWKDYVTDAEMSKIYGDADGFVIMSPYEGQSIVTLQAVACGLPVIAANASALPELVKNGKNGFLVTTYDFKTLAAKMNLLATDFKMRTRFGRESRKISLEHDKKVVLQKLEKIYLDLAGRV